MSELVLVDDFPEGFGGSELVNNTVINSLNVDKVIASSKLESIDESAFYIVSNISTMRDIMVMSIATKANYIILEHDYKFIRSRHPWRYENSLVPKDELMNTILYKNAKAVFVQTEDHLDVFRRNGIEGNFISLQCSIWSDSELNLLQSILKENNQSSSKFCVIESDSWIKNQQGAETFLKQNKISYDLVRANTNPEEFLRAMSKYACLAFFPVARESCCRLIVEAKCMGMNVITSPNSGAWQSDWYGLEGEDLIKHLRRQSRNNLETMKQYLPGN
jgi:hypothetical protein